LTAKSLMSTFEVQWSLEGTQRRLWEQQTLSYFLDFLNQVEGTNGLKHFTIKCMSYQGTTVSNHDTVKWIGYPFHGSIITG